jgi:hypothetical protein
VERKLIGRRQFLSALAGSGALALSGVAFAPYDAAQLLLSSRRTRAMTSPTRLPSERLPEQGHRYDSLAIDTVVDTTSSTLMDYAYDARNRTADLVDSLVISGQGPISLFLNKVGPDSYAPASTLLAVRLPATPRLPGRRPTKPRPSIPDDAGCQKETFGKQRCIDSATAAYASDLCNVMADEAKAQADYENDLKVFNEELLAARFNAKRQTDQLRQCALDASDTASDIMGAFIVASQNLAATGASFRLLIAQSDLMPYGRQSAGEIELTGVHVRVIDWDVRDAAAAKHSLDLWHGRFRDAGAASVRFLTPAQTAVTDLMEET